MVWICQLITLDQVSLINFSVYPLPQATSMTRSCPWGIWLKAISWDLRRDI
ncbi:hypothetical protein MEN41_04010 [Dolichospermum sp. ST_con]|nr:hypothetical protein [Dolichospermum sp. ST_con]MDD1417910.1 hypothetical protein [Dolichospermum sp. ST_sed1]MDD1423857.1 hypothetical protein [Dolichospermum sp. ST_sed9]MDD1429672.1 hypothetical protein [Dolichospermum sp. ST_sed6]MDD1439297.1 hypothetical protein [Dolichospermum sp. ST_sed3]MDD1445079.1 hypothetical protein [Dolichospermum sp. ST_sed8]MDD1455493.1 hypothetical protein [Dolichospermum sp. ST_sed7]MDD1459281.1 hypothetical protein [Dolichospermum sp. ST_sed2]MDD1463744